MNTYYRLAYEFLPRGVRSAFKPDAPPALKDAIISRKIELTPQDWLIVSYYLLHDENATIAAAAQEALGNITAAELHSLTQSPLTLPHILDFLARNQAGHSDVLQLNLIKNPRCYDATLTVLCAADMVESVLSALITQTRRISRNPWLFKSVMVRAAASAKSHLQAMVFPYQRLPETVTARIPQDASPKMLLAAAKGTLSLPPVDMILLLYFLLFQADPEVASQAEVSLQHLPISSFQALAQSTRYPDVYDFFSRARMVSLKHTGDSRQRQTEELFWSEIVRNNATLPETLAFLAGEAESEAVLQAIAQKTGKIMANPAIFDRLLGNPFCPEPLLQKVLSCSPDFHISYMQFKSSVIERDYSREMRAIIARIARREKSADEDAPKREVESEDEFDRRFLKIPFTLLAPQLRHYLDEKSPKALKKEIAHGDIGFSPVHKAEAAYFLAFYRDRSIREIARSCLQAWPEAFWAEVISNATVLPQILDFIATSQPASLSLAEKIVRLPNSYDRTICQIARSSGSESLLTLIAGQTARIRRSPELFHILRERRVAGFDAAAPSIRPRYEDLPASLRQRFRADSAMPARIAAAKGFLPGTHQEQLELIFFLLFDEARVSQMAQQTWQSFSPEFFSKGIGPGTRPEILDSLAHLMLESTARYFLPDQKKAGYFELMEKLYLHRHCQEAMASFIVANLESSVSLQLIEQNMRRFEQYPALFWNLLMNRHILKNSIERMVSNSGIFKIALEQYQAITTRLLEPKINLRIYDELLDDEEERLSRTSRRRQSEDTRPRREERTQPDVVPESRVAADYDDRPSEAEDVSSVEASPASEEFWYGDDLGADWSENTADEAAEEPVAELADLDLPTFASVESTSSAAIIDRIGTFQQPISSDAFDIECDISSLARLADEEAEAAGYPDYADEYYEDEATQLFGEETSLEEELESDELKTDNDMTQESNFAANPAGSDRGDKANASPIPQVAAATPPAEARETIREQFESIGRKLPQIGYVYITYRMLSPDVMKVLPENAPYEIRKMVATGKSSLEPRELITAAYYLMFDEAEDIRALARETLLKIPDEVLQLILASIYTLPQLLDFYGQEKKDNQHFLQLVVKNRRVYDRTLCRICKECQDAAVLDLLVERADAIRRSPVLFQLLSQHALLSSKQKDQIFMGRFTYEELPETTRKSLKKDAPPAIKSAIARGTYPMPPPDMVAALIYLMYDADRKISNPAIKTLRNTPVSILTGVAEKLQQPRLINILARELIALIHDKDDEPHELSGLNLCLEKLCVNKSTPDETLTYLGSETKSEYLLDIIGNSLTRIQENPEIYQGLLLNRLIANAILLKIRDFSPELLEVYETHQKAWRKDVAQIKPIIWEQEAYAPIIEDMPFEEFEKLAEDIDFESSLVDDLENKMAPEEAGELRVKIVKMNMVQRRLLALKGNYEARSILFKMYNKAIQEFVLKNPKITPEEVERFAYDKMVDDSIVRTIAQTERWTKMYSVKLALLHNPKTPVHFAYKNMETLKTKDLLSLSKSKDVSGMVGSMAKRIYRLRTSGDTD